MYLIIISIGLGFMLLERLIPDQELPHSPHWWLRAIAFNIAQLGVVLAGGLLWDAHLQRAHLFDVPQYVDHVLLQGLVGYVVSTFVYYWWHRFRHMSDFLWLGLHQLHHSPVRLETITAFYKHPAELISNSVLSGLISYTLLGLDIEAAGWTTGLSAISEFFYHMNVKTPRWIGLFIQRPEMHRIHHERGVHQSNYGDLPIWDMLFGTYHNPPTYDGPCGFDEPRESMVLEMLLFKDVNASSKGSEP
jgi:sterol desaturase/sphingolipid hydroxylase (fatty acid hydroxylase superfamily)